MELPFFTPIDQALFDSRTIQVSGPVGSELAKTVVARLLALEQKDPDAPIVLMINSPGGEITSGFSIYDTARFIKPEVTTLVSGLAASMGSLIALCAPKERRVAMPNAKFLIHQPLIAGYIQGSATELEIHAKDILATKQKINQMYADETGRSIDEVKQATDRDNWMTTEEALEFGLISRVVHNRGDLGL